MVEQKIIYRAQENYDEATEQMKHYQSYGWVYVGKKENKSENNNVEALYLQRDLDDPKNQELKAMQDDEDAVVRAMKFCENNIAYCDSKIDTYYEVKKIFIILAIVIALFGLANIAFGVLFAVYPDFLKAMGATVEESEYIVIIDDIPYLVLPAGMTMFGMTQINIYNLFAVVLSGIGAMLLVIAGLITYSRINNRIIAKSRIRYFRSLKEDYETLDERLSDWSLEKSKKGFDPYQGATFNNFK